MRFSFSVIILFVLLFQDFINYGDGQTLTNKTLVVGDYSFPYGCTVYSYFSISWSQRIESQMISAHSNVPIIPSITRMPYSDDLSNQMYQVGYTTQKGINIQLDVTLVDLPLVNQTFILGTFDCSESILQPFKLLYNSNPSNYLYNTDLTNFIVVHNTTGNLGNINTFTNSTFARISCASSLYAKLLYCYLGISSVGSDQTIYMTLQFFNSEQSNDNNITISNPYLNTGGSASITTLFPYSLSFSYPTYLIVQRSGLVNLNAIITSNNSNIMIIPKYKNNQFTTYEGNIKVIKKNSTLTTYLLTWNYPSSFNFAWLNFGAQIMGLNILNPMDFANVTFSPPVFDYKSQNLTLKYVDSSDTSKGVFAEFLFQPSIVNDFSIRVFLYTDNNYLVPMCFSNNITTGQITYNFYIPLSINFTEYLMGGYFTNSPNGNMNIIRNNITKISSYFSIDYIQIDRTLSKPGYILTIALNTSKPLVRVRFDYDVLNDTDVVERIDIPDAYSYTIYQKYINYQNLPSFYITPLDISVNSKQFIPGEVMNDRFMTVPNFKNIPPPSILREMVTVIDLSHFSFNVTNVDLSNGPVGVRLSLNFTKYIPYSMPYIVFDGFEQYSFTGYYEPFYQMFIIDMVIDTWLFSPEIFVIRDRNDYIVEEIQSTFISSYFKNVPNTKFTISNPNGDNSPILITELHVFPTLNPQTLLTNIEWTFKIENCKFGFKNGRALIISDYDPLPYEINITSSNRIDGDEFNGVYSFNLSVNLNSCRSQNYTLTELTLESNSKGNLRFNSINSILNTKYQQNLFASISCLVTKNPNIVLQAVTLPSSIDVGQFNRSIQIGYSVYSLSARSSRHKYSYAFLTSENGDVISIKCEYSFDNNNIYSYICNGELPYGFGYNVIYVSFYGIAFEDTFFQSFSPIQIAQKGQPYFIKREFNFTIPQLLNHSWFTNKGGRLIAYGKAMGIDNSVFSASIDYDDGFGPINIIPSFRSSIILQFDNIKEIKSKNVTIQISVNSVKSNYLYLKPLFVNYIPIPTIPPTITPTSSSSPSLCPGTPPCNSRGICIPNSGCNCQSPWFGPSCSSEIIIVNPPIPQAEPTTVTNVTTKDGQSISSIVEILEVREIDQLNNIIQRHKINNWDITNLTNESNNQKFLYSSKLSETETTINTTIEFFKDKSTIEFGSETLTIQPSSIKFTIRLSSYPFQSKTNLIQIVMDATILGSQDKCSFTQYGSQNNSKDNIQWIKINIDRTSLYGRFIDFGLIDERVTRITNRIIDDSTSNSSSIKVGITIPYYDNTVYLDPDFSNLIDINDDEKDQFCRTKPKKKLSTGAIIGIVVGCFAASMIVGAVYYFHRKHKSTLERKKIEAKLKRIDK